MEAAVSGATFGRERWRKLVLGFQFATAAQLVHQRNLQRLGQHGEAVTLIVDEESVLRKWQVGDNAMYEAAAIEQRYENRSDPEVVAALDAWWSVAKREEAAAQAEDGEGSKLMVLRRVSQADSSDTKARALARRVQLRKTCYVNVWMRISKALLEEGEEWDEAEATRLVEASWTHDANGREEFMTRVEFQDSLFECADMWTLSTEAQEYADFLYQLLSQLGCADHENATGWAGINDVQVMVYPKPSAGSSVADACVLQVTGEKGTAGLDPARLARLAERTEKSVGKKMMGALKKIQGKAKTCARKGKKKRLRAPGASISDSGSDSLTKHKNMGANGKQGPAPSGSDVNDESTEDDSRALRRHASSLRAQEIMDARRNKSTLGFGSSVQRFVEPKLSDGAIAETIHEGGNMDAAAAMLQARTRAKNAQKALSMARRAAVRVQTRFRARFDLWTFMQQKRAIRVIQQRWRNRRRRRAKERMAGAIRRVTHGLYATPSALQHASGLQASPSNFLTEVRDGTGVVDGARLAGGHYPMSAGGHYPMSAGGHYSMAAGGQYPGIVDGHNPMSAAGHYPMSAGGHYPIQDVPVHGGWMRPGWMEHWSGGCKLTLATSASSAAMPTLLTPLQMNGSPRSRLTTSKSVDQIRSKPRQLSPPRMRSAAVPPRLRLMTPPAFATLPAFPGGQSPVVSPRAMRQQSLSPSVVRMQARDALAKGGLPSLSPAAPAAIGRTALRQWQATTTHTGREPWRAHLGGELDAAAPWNPRKHSRRSPQRVTQSKPRLPPRRR